MAIPFDLQTFLIAAVVVAGAYVIFGISAFGAALFTVPIADWLVGFAILLPFALADLWLGNRIHGRISRAGLLRVVAGLLLLIGASLLARVLAGG